MFLLKCFGKRNKHQNDVHPISVTTTSTSTSTSPDNSKIDAYTGEAPDEGEQLYMTHEGCYTVEENIINLFNTYFENTNNFTSMIQKQSMSKDSFMKYLNEYNFIIVCPMCKNKKNNLININNVVKSLPDANKIKLNEIMQYIIKEWEKKKLNLLDCIKCSSLSKQIQNNIYQCTSETCKCIFCNLCKIAYKSNNKTESDKIQFTHDGLTCDEAKAFNMKNIREFDILLNSTRCPNTSCNYLIERNEGCNQIKCIKCDTVLCYVCGELWDKHHVSHSTCPYENKQHKNYIKTQSIMPLITKFKERQQELVNEMKERIKNDIKYLDTIDDQTNELCYFALDQDYTALQYIKNQTFDMCKYALTKNGKAFDHIRNKTDDIYKYVFRNKILSLKDVEQTEHICEIALDIDGLNLRDVDINVKTDNLCKIAVKQNGLAIEFVDNQNSAICISAIYQNAHSIKHISNQTETLIKLAIELKASSLEHVLNQTYAICAYAIHRDYKAIQYVREQTSELCKLAMCYNTDAFQYISNKTDEICEIALRKNIRYETYIENKSEYINDLIDLLKISQRNNNNNNNYKKSKWNIGYTFDDDDVKFFHW